MISQALINDLPHLIHSPFARLRELLGDIEPGQPPIDMSIGEPRHGMPEFLPSLLYEHAAGFAKYPPIRGTDALLGAIAAWIERRYPGLRGVIAPEKHILPLSGSREGLFSAIFPALARKPSLTRPAVLIPNPFYQAYLAATLAAGAEPVFLPAAANTGFLPDLDAISAPILQRTAAMYLASPSNPQGAVASEAYLRRLIELARAHDFLLFLDECYSEIYLRHPPSGGLEVAAALSGDFRNVIIFQSLSKRSNVPGLRSGFTAGDADFIEAFARFRNVACPQMPLPVQHASAALWADEAHVERSRQLYRRKFETAERFLAGRAGFALPQGGFFLWLDLQHLGGGEEGTKRIWKGYGVKILPGAYLGQTGQDGRNPGEAYARVALADDLETTETAVRRIAAAL